MSQTKEGKGKALVSTEESQTARKSRGFWWCPGVSDSDCYQWETKERSGESEGPTLKRVEKEEKKEVLQVRDLGGGLGVEHV